MGTPGFKGRLGEALPRVGRLATALAEVNLGIFRGNHLGGFARFNIGFFHGDCLRGLCVVQLGGSSMGITWGLCVVQLGDSFAGNLDFSSFSFGVPWQRITRQSLVRFNLCTPASISCGRKQRALYGSTSGLFPVWDRLPVPVW